MAAKELGAAIFGAAVVACAGGCVLGEGACAPAADAVGTSPDATATAWASLNGTAAVTHGPARGSLIIVGGGRPGKEIVDEFERRAGGPEVPIVIIPTALPDDDFGPAWKRRNLWATRFPNATVLHTRDRSVADSEAFVAPLRWARGVWIGGGRQWRLVDAYLHTRTQAELRAVLDRGGVIGGTSAGASIQASYLVRGDPRGNQIMMARGYEEGFGFLENAAIDQHMDERRREGSLVPVVAAHPGLLGVGIDASTAVVVHGDRMRVIGAGQIAVYDGRAPREGAPYYFLSHGDELDLATRRRR
jgi:cyanophycinase